MARHDLIERDGVLFCPVADDYGDEEAMLIVRYAAGDCDTVRADSHLQKIVAALYDLYQVNDHLRDGDEFWLRGKRIAVCEGIHVKYCL